MEDLYKGEQKGEYIEPQVEEGTKIETWNKTRNDRHVERQGCRGRWSCSGNVRGVRGIWITEIDRNSKHHIRYRRNHPPDEQIYLHYNAKIIRNHRVQQTQNYSHHEPNNKNHSKSDFEPNKGKDKRRGIRRKSCFLEGKATSNAKFAHKVSAGSMVEKQKDLYMCFVDYETAFDLVKDDELMAILNIIKDKAKDLRLKKGLYWKQRASVRLETEEKEEICIEKEGRQSCVISPDFFNLYGEIILREVQSIGGGKTGGKNLNFIGYAYDIVLMTETVQGLQHLVNAIDEASSIKGPKLNVK